MKVYVINLDSRQDRIEFMSAQAEARGFTFERITAADGTAPDFLARAEQLDTGFKGVRLTAVEIACFESHRKAWRALLETSDEYGVILEDDMVVSSEFSSLLSDTWIPENADLVRLETFLTLTKFDSSPVMNVGGRKLHRQRSSSWGAGAYILSRQVAKDLLEQTLEFRDPVDDVLFDERSPLFSKFSIYQIIPAPAIQGDKLKSTLREDWAQSSLKQDRDSRQHPEVKKIWLNRFRFWRRIKYRFQRLIAWMQGHLLSPVPFK